MREERRDSGIVLGSPKTELTWDGWKFWTRVEGKDSNSAKVWFIIAESLLVFDCSESFLRKPFVICKF